MHRHKVSNALQCCIQSCANRNVFNSRSVRLRSRGQRSRSLEPKCKNRFFAHILIKSGSIYLNSRPKWPATHSTHIVRFILSTEMFHFCDNLELSRRSACRSGPLAMCLLAIVVFIELCCLLEHGMVIVAVLWTDGCPCDGGTAAAAPPQFRPGNPALCGSHPLVTPYNCRLGDLLCLFVYAVFVCYFCLCTHMCNLCFLCVFLCCFPLQLSPSVLWYCWLGLFDL